MAVWSRRAEPNVFKPVTDLRCEATVRACGRGDGVSALPLAECLGSRRGVRRALASTASAWARVDVVLACRPPLALLFSPSPLDGVQRALYGERAAELRTKAAHGSKETILRAQNCSQVVATALRRTKSRGDEFTRCHPHVFMVSSVGPL